MCRCRASTNEKCVPKVKIHGCRNETVEMAAINEGWHCAVPGAYDSEWHHWCWFYYELRDKCMFVPYPFALAHHGPDRWYTFVWYVSMYSPVCFWIFWICVSMLCAAFRMKLLVDRKLFSPTDLAFFTHFSFATAIFHRISYSMYIKRAKGKKWAREMKAILNKFKNVSL